MSYYRRHLPHWQPKNATFFITFRLAGSLPSSAIVRLKREKVELQCRLDKHKLNPKLSSSIEAKIFSTYEEILDSNLGGPHWLARSDIAEILTESIEYRNHKKYDLIAYCIMPNHVHMILKLLTHNLKDVESKDYPLTRVLQGLKSYTALIGNRKLNRSGPFWQSESYDHVIRDYDELERVIIYTLNNPVKAGLAVHWKKWRHSYCDPALLPDF